MSIETTQSDPPSDESTRLLRSYVEVCLEVKTRFDECLEEANHAAGARNMANQRPQHEISIANFTKMAEQVEAEFPDKYSQFAAGCDRARETAGVILASGEQMQLEMLLFEMFDPETMDTVALVKRILQSRFGPTVSEFLQGLEETNSRLADESGGLGNIYTPAASSGVGA